MDVVAACAVCSGGGYLSVLPENTNVIKQHRERSSKQRQRYAAITIRSLKQSALEMQKGLSLSLPLALSPSDDFASNEEDKCSMTGR